MDYKVKEYVKKSIYTNLEDIANAHITRDKRKGKTLLLTVNCSKLCGQYKNAP